jgi:HPr kinase/phosphorylase
MIEGPSGSGKSALALELMAFGAALVADDRTLLRLGAGPVAIWAEAPPTLPALIEARGMGLLRARLAGPVPLSAVVRLDQVETDRLPDRRSITILEREVTMFHRPERGPFAAALVQYLRASEEKCS